MNLTNLELVDGSGYDIPATSIVTAQAFDTLHNTTFPDAKSFVRVIAPEGTIVLLTNTPFEALLAATAGQGMLALTGADGNRVLLRPQDVVTRRGDAETSSLTLSVQGETIVFDFSVSLADLRAAMNPPSLPPITDLRPAADAPALDAPDAPTADGAPTTDVLWVPEAASAGAEAA